MRCSGPTDHFLHEAANSFALLVGAARLVIGAKSELVRTRTIAQPLVAEHSSTVLASEATPAEQRVRLLARGR
jgi:hypothetical protein